ICGRRTYLVGAQDGSFPDIGHHVPGEMGGLWSHPIKVLDGFWLGFVIDGRVYWQPQAEKFWHSPLASGFWYRFDAVGTVEAEVFIPSHHEGMLVTYRICHDQTGGAPRRIRVAFLARTELRGVWLSDRLGWEDGPDETRFDADTGLVVARDSRNPWFAVLGSPSATVRRWDVGEIWGPEQTAGRGTSVLLEYDVTLDQAGRGELVVAVASSPRSEEEALQGWRFLVGNAAELRWEKEEHLNQIIAQSTVELPDQELESAFDWLKVNYEMLVRDVPGFGFGLAAGLPTYPWWFGCDNSYALLGALPLGMFELSKATLRLLARYSQEANASGRIIHEVVTNGVVFNPGNTQETPHFTMAVYDTWLWTGDDQFLQEMYPLCRQGVLQWLLGEMDADGDLFPSGYGIMEVAGLNAELVDSAIYTQQALVCLAQMAEYLGDRATAVQARDLAAQALADFESRFWLEEEGLYADVQASPEQLLARVNDMRKQPGNEDPKMRAALEEYETWCKSAQDQHTELPWLFKNWVIFCPLEVGTAPKERAARALARMYTPEFTDEIGLYLNGIVQGKRMTISTGVAAVAQARYGYMDRALKYINQIVAISNMRFPGAPSEMMPDEGCVVQAWSGYGVVYPVVRQFLGFEPNAPQKRFKLRPYLPGDWGRTAIRRLRIGEAHLDLAVRKGRCSVELEIVIDQPGWSAAVEVLPEWTGWRESEFLVAGRVQPVTDGILTISLEPGVCCQITVVPKQADEMASNRAETIL
ncbi:MAG: amylo-alpha-1,6-glucosidase, partial [Limnochordia bacterium]